MLNILNDEEFTYYIKDILLCNEFKKIDNIDHHGITRLEHSLKVSYYSYKITKFLKLNYIVTARAGLLHDFFLSNENRNLKERFLSTFVHPKYSLENSTKYFELNDLGKNIIESHMFPIYKSLPKYAESWIVSFVDKICAISEFGKTFSIGLNYALNILILIIINYIKI